MVVTTRASAASKAAKATPTKSTPKTIQKTKSIRPTIPLKTNVPKPRRSSKAMSTAKSDHPGMKCYANGPGGPPIYDHLGYELSYEKCRKVRALARPLSSSYYGSNYMKMIQDDLDKDARKRKLLGLPDCDAPEAEMDYKLSKILDKPFHKITMADYERFHKKGFKLEPEDVVVSRENGEWEDMMDVELGSAFRK